MKRPQPDINKRTMESFVAKVGGTRKLRRLWGTTVVDGTEVLNLRRMYHTQAQRPANFEELFKFLQVYEDVKDYDGKGLRSAWFTLNKDKGEDGQSISPSFVADNLNRMWWDDNDGLRPDNLTLTTTVVIGGRFDKVRSTAGVNWLNTKDVIAQDIINRYESLWGSNKITQEGVGVINKGSLLDPTLKVDVVDEDDLSPDDPWLAVLSRYVLRNSGIPCVVKDVEVGLSGGLPTYNFGVADTTVSVTIEIPYFEFDINSPIVQRIYDDLDDAQFPSPRANLFYDRWSTFNGFSRNNEQVTKSDVKKVTFYDETPEVGYEDIVTRSYISWSDGVLQGSLYDSLWIQSGGNWYFRADVITNPKAYGINHHELNTYIFGLLDTGYRKKKVKWYKKAIAFVIFVIAVVVTYISLGAASPVTGPIMLAASAVLVGALVVSLVTMALSAVGVTDWAMAFAWVSRTIEPLVTVASIIMVIDILSTAADMIAEQGLAALGDIAASQILGATVTDLLAVNLTSTQIVTVVNKAVTAYTNAQLGKLENISNKNKDLKAEYEKLAEESAMDTDIMIGYMNIYARPATADWSIYASTYDMPYERAGGSLSMGNIQKTTRQAMRKADYDEPMFEGMMLV